MRYPRLARCGVRGRCGLGIFTFKNHRETFRFGVTRVRGHLDNRGHPSARFGRHGHLVLQVRGIPLVISRVALGAVRVALCLFTATVVTAVPAPAQWYLGLEAGPTYATWSGSFVEASGIWGARFAVQVEHRFLGRWTVAAAGVWQQKGASNVRARDALVAADFKSSHLAIPVTVGREVPLASGWMVNPHAGVATAVTADCQVKDSATFEFEEDCGVAIPATETAAVQLDILVGLRLVRSYPGGARFSAAVRHEVGLTQVLPDLVPSGESARNRSWSFTGGFSLPLF